MQCLATKVPKTGPISHSVYSLYRPPITASDILSKFQEQSESSDHRETNCIWNFLQVIVPRISPQLPLCVWNSVTSGSRNSLGLLHYLFKHSFSIPTPYTTSNRATTYISLSVCRCELPERPTTQMYNENTFTGTDAGVMQDRLQLEISSGSLCVGVESTVQPTHLAPSSDPLWLAC